MLSLADARPTLGAGHATTLNEERMPRPRISPHLIISPHRTSLTLRCGSELAADDKVSRARRSSIEAYGSGGRAVASHRVYPTAAQLKVGLELINLGTAAATISGTAWPMMAAARPSVESLLE